MKGLKHNVYFQQIINAALKTVYFETKYYLTFEWVFWGEKAENAFVMLAWCLYWRPTWKLTLIQGWGASSSESVTSNQKPVPLLTANKKSRLVKIKWMKYSNITRESFKKIFCNYNPPWDEIWYKDVM